MIELTKNARHMINQRLAITHRMLYLRWQEDCSLSESQRLEVLDAVCNVLREKGQSQLTFPTISQYESWLLCSGLAKRTAVLSVSRRNRIPANRIWNDEKLAKLGQLLKERVGINDIADSLRVTSTQVRTAMHNYPEIKPT